MRRIAVRGTLVSMPLRPSSSAFSALLFFVPGLAILGIAAMGCTANHPSAGPDFDPVHAAATPDGVDTNPTAAPRPSRDAGTDALEPLGDATAEASRPAAESDAAVLSPDGGAVVDAAVTDAAVDDAAVDDAATEASSSDAGSTEGGSNACDDDVELVAGGYACPTNGSAVGCLDEFDCTQNQRRMKPRLRDLLDSCLSTSDIQACFPDRGSSGERRRCYATVLRATCADPSAATFCRSLRASACANGDGGARLVGCESYAAILNDVGRRELYACVNRMACADDAVDECRHFFLGQ